MPPAHSARRSLSASPEVVSAGIAVIVAVAYLILYRSQHDGFSARSIFVAAHLVVVAGAMAWSTRAQGSFARAALLAGAANSLILVGFLGLFSIGLPLLIAGLIAMPALARALTNVPRPAGPAVVGLATLVAAGIMIAGLLATR